MTPCKTIDIDVPADAEFVLEGYVDKRSPVRRAVRRSYRRVQAWRMRTRRSTFNASRAAPRRFLRRRRSSVKPPMEDAWLGKATERIFLPLLQMVVPEIRRLQFTG